MAEFVESFNGLKPFLPTYLMDLDPSLEIMNQFGELSEGVMENPSLGMMGFSNECYLSQPPEFSMPFDDRLPRMPPVEQAKPAVEPQQPSDPVRKQEQSQGGKKRKAKVGAESSTENSSSVLTGVKEDNSKKRNSSGGGKRGRNNSSKDGEGPKEVVHVRARRGQATDSHSLAERVRREKINERMRCLQGLVPGCYKTMGMAVMLDEIINYVQSLQNQVEFLSMKLSAASSFCDLDSDMEAMAAPQVFPRVGNAYNEEAQEVERLVREGYGGCTSFHSSMPF